MVSLSNHVAIPSHPPPKILSILSIDVGLGSPLPMGKGPGVRGVPCEEIAALLYRPIA